MPAYTHHAHHWIHNQELDNPVFDKMALSVILKCECGTFLNILLPHVSVWKKQKLFGREICAPININMCDPKEMDFRNEKIPDEKYRGD